MNRKPIPFAIVLVPTLTATVALGQSAEDTTPRRGQLMAEAGPTLDEFHLSYLMGFNISARLRNRNLGNTPTFPAPPPPPAGAGPFVSATGIIYQDGYVGVDSSGNSGDSSWYWGYARNDQVVADNVLLSYSRPGTLFNDFHQDPQHGMEASYRWRYRESNGSKIGMEAAFSFMDLDLGVSGEPDRRVVGVHAFPLAGVLPPQPPENNPPAYTGTWEGPGALIYSTNTIAKVNIDAKLDGVVYGFKLGPYAAWSLGEKVSFGVSGGFALLLHDSDFRVRQSVSFAGQTTSSVAYFHSDLGVLPGGYIGGELTYKASDKVSWFTSLHYQNNGRHSHSVGDKEIEINFEEALFLSVGFSYSY